MILKRPFELKSSFFLLLLLITIAGGIFRTVELSRESLWEDEMGSLIIARKPLAEVLRMPKEFNEYHPPLYFVLLNLWMRFFPQSEFWLRFPSVLFGTISVFLIGFLAKQWGSGIVLTDADRHCEEALPTKQSGPETSARSALVRQCGNDARLSANSCPHQKWFGEYVGLLSALFLALSPYHVSYSQEARNYSLSMMLVVLSLISYRAFSASRESAGASSVGLLTTDADQGKVFRDTAELPAGAEKAGPPDRPGSCDGAFHGGFPAWLKRTAFVLSHVALLYTNSLGLFVLVLENIHFLCVHGAGRNVAGRPSLADWIAHQAVIGLLFLPWMPRILEQAAAMRDGWWMNPPSILTLLWIFPNYCGALTSCHASMDNDPTPGVLLSFLFALLALGSLFRISVTHASLSSDSFMQKIREAAFELRIDLSKEQALLICWGAVPILLPFFLSLIGTPVFMARSSMAASLAFFVLAAKGVWTIPSRRLRNGLILIITALSLLGLLQYYLSPYKDHWREAANHLEEHAQPGDLIIVSSARCEKSFGYYFRKKSIETQPFPVSDFRISEGTLAELLPKALRYEKVWLLISFHIFGDGNLPVKALMKEFSLASGKEFFGLQLFEFRRKQKQE